MAEGMLIDFFLPDVGVAVEAKEAVTRILQFNFLLHSVLLADSGVLLGRAVVRQLVDNGLFDLLVGESEGRRTSVTH